MKQLSSTCLDAKSGHQKYLGYTWSPPLRGRRAVLQCLLRVENPAGSSLLILVGGRVRRPRVGRAGIHNGFRSYLLSCRNHLSLQRAPIKSTQTTCSRLQQRGGAASGWTGSAGTRGGFRKLTAKGKSRILCASGGHVIRSGFPRTHAEHKVYIHILGNTQPRNLGYFNPAQTPCLSQTQQPMQVGAGKPHTPCILQHGQRGPIF